jgi:hypothetical protein
MLSAATAPNAHTPANDRATAAQTANVMNLSLEYMRHARLARRRRGLRVSTETPPQYLNAGFAWRIDKHMFFVFEYIRIHVLCKELFLNICSFFLRPFSETFFAVEKVFRKEGLSKKAIAYRYNNIEVVIVNLV